MRFTLLLSLLVLTLASCVTTVPVEDPLVASPDGVGDCSRSAPCSIHDAFGQASPGDLIELEPGTYAIDERIRITRSGTAQEPIEVRAQGAIIDAAALDRSLWYAVALDGARWWRIEGLSVTSSPGYGIRLANGASNNTLTQCTTYANDLTGVHLEGAGTAGNVVEYCDSYNNYDPETHGQNADGFAAKNGAGSNTFRYDRAFNNADDGWDFWEGGPQRVEYSVAYANGFDRWDDAAFEGNGNGFKLGGSDEGIPTGGHELFKVIAYRNARWGFNDNNGEVPNSIVRVTAFDHAERNFQLHKGAHVLERSISAQGRNLFSDLTVVGDNLLDADASVFVSVSEGNDAFLAPLQEFAEYGALDAGESIDSWFS